MPSLRTVWKSVEDRLGSDDFLFPLNYLDKVKLPPGISMDWDNSWGPGVWVISCRALNTTGYVKPMLIKETHKEFFIRALTSAWNLWQDMVLITEMDPRAEEIRNGKLHRDA